MNVKFAMGMDILMNAEFVILMLIMMDILMNVEFVIMIQIMIVN